LFARIDGDALAAVVGRLRSLCAAAGLSVAPIFTAGPLASPTIPS